MTTNTTSTNPVTLTLDFCGFGRTCHIIDSKGRHAILTSLDYGCGNSGDGRMLYGLSDTDSHRFDLINFLPFVAESFSAQGVGSKPQDGVMRIIPIEVAR